MSLGGVTAMKEENVIPDPLLEGLKDGDEAAAVAVFERFARRLIGLARSQLDTRLRQKVDPEDVVQSVFRSFFTRQKEQQFKLTDWDNLWSLLAMITIRKCTNVQMQFGRQARNVRLETRPQASGDSSASSWQALGREPTPAEAAVLTDLVSRLLASLTERERRIVVLSLDGKTPREISDEIDRAERTVRRTLEHFRAKLEKAVLEPASVF
jgi:RNA polymerase sigma-70 factor, ECF subfamily